MIIPAWKGTPHMLTALRHTPLLFALLMVLLLAGCDNSSGAAQPTATPNNHFARGGAATLGGTVDAFTALWGKPGSQDDVSATYQQQCGADGKAWCKELDTLPGADGKRYVAVITLQGPTGNGIWDVKAAESVCERYLPKDAAFLQETPATFADNSSGLERVFTAPSLAQTFPADQFNDIQGNDVQPGTFNIQYFAQTSLDTDQISGCRISLGTAI